MRLGNVGMDGDGRIRTQKSPNQPQNPNINPKKTLGVGFFLPEFFQGSKKIPFPPPKSLPVDLGSFPRLVPNPGAAAGPAPLPVFWWERRKIWGFWGFHPKIPGVDPKGFPGFFWGGISAIWILNFSGFNSLQEQLSREIPEFIGMGAWNPWENIPKFCPAGKNRDLGGKKGSDSKKTREFVHAETKIGSGNAPTPILGGRKNYK